jgi:hypothetical protein
MEEELVVVHRRFHMSRRKRQGEEEADPQREHQELPHTSRIHLTGAQKGLQKNTNKWEEADQTCFKKNKKTKTENEKKKEIPILKP